MTKDKAGEEQLQGLLQCREEAKKRIEIIQKQISHMIDDNETTKQMLQTAVQEIEEQYCMFKAYQEEIDWRRWRCVGGNKFD